MIMNNIKKNISINQKDIEQFIKDLDNDPNSKNTRCCDGTGVCTSFTKIKKTKK